MQSKIVSAGHSVLGASIDSTSIENSLGLENGWIEKRTGIRQRWICPDGTGVSKLAVDAVRSCLERVGQVNRDNIGLVLLATSTPDHMLPPTSPLLCEQLGLRECGAIDLTGACSGFLYGLILADSYTRINKKLSIVIGANVLSSRLDKSDPTTAGLFSDAAGAVLIAPVSNNSDAGVIVGHSFGHKGHLYDDIIIPAGGSANPFNSKNLHEKYISIPNGKRVFHAAVDSLVDRTEAVLDTIDLTTDDISFWLPHQANLRIINKAAKRLGLGQEKCIVTIDEYGNSSAATIPLSLSLKFNMLQRSGLTVSASVGAGMLDAAVAIQF